MLLLTNYPYSRQEIIDALHGKHGNRQIRFRYDLLDKNDNKIKELDSVIDGEVSMASLSSIKRTAKFRLKDKGDINWLTDRIQPFVELKMPEIKRKHDNYALEFDGVDDKVDVPHSDELNISKNLEINATVTVYNTSNNWGRIVHKGNDTVLGNNNFCYNIRYDRSGGFRFSINVNSEWNSIACPLELNKKYKLKMTYDGNVFKAFVDGVEVGSLNVPGTIQEDMSNLQIGSVYDGLIDEVEILNNGVKVGHWKFNEGKGSIAKDSTPNGNDGIIHGAKWKKNGIEVETIPSSWIEFPLGIFLLSSPTRKDENNFVYREVEAYDGLLILRDDKFDTRYTVTAGTNYRQAVIDILASAGITKHNIEQTDKVLPVDMEFAPGTEKLEAINTLLRAINYTPLHVDVYGYFTSMTYRSPSIRAAEYTYKDDELSIIYAGMEEELDLFNVANRWVVVCSNAEQSLMSTYTNSNPDSPTSTVNRGRTIVDYREVTDIADQQSLDAYVQRIAFEASQVYGKLTFETALNPLHDYADVLQIEYSPLGISGKYSETSWTMPLKAGARMKHEVRKVVNI
ncbi:LamG-like jellyroll fold domain-containing protein [Aeribacillus pallidus]|uniref:LamG-like jellyroll fold domain-containing protein n=1 Tax=Aeribacillus pallidus TaxID=33936 RepID=UPI003D1BD800